MSSKDDVRIYQETIGERNVWIVPIGWNEAFKEGDTLIGFENLEDALAEADRLDVEWDNFFDPIKVRVYSPPAASLRLLAMGILPKGPDPKQWPVERRERPFYKRREFLYASVIAVTLAVVLGASYIMHRTF